MNYLDSVEENLLALRCSPEDSISLHYQAYKELNFPDVQTYAHEMEVQWISPKNLAIEKDSLWLIQINDEIPQATHSLTQIIPEDNADLKLFLYCMEESFKSYPEYDPVEVFYMKFHYRLCKSANHELSRVHELLGSAEEKFLWEWKYYYAKGTCLDCSYALSLPELLGYRSGRIQSDFLNKKLERDLKINKKEDKKTKI